MSILSIFFHGRRKQMQENSEALAQARASNQRSTDGYLEASGRLESTLGTLMSDIDGLPRPIPVTGPTRRRDGRP